MDTYDPKSNLRLYIESELNLSRRAYRWLTHEDAPGAKEKIDTIYAILNELFQGQDVTITYEAPDFKEPFSSLGGSVIVTGKDLVINNPALFLRLSRMCYSYDFEPLTSGDVHLVLGIKDLIREID